MALSDIERNRRYEIIHTMQNIFDSEIIGKNRECVTSESSVPVNEAADTRMKDLRDVEAYLSGKKLPYFGTYGSPKAEGNIKVSLLFMSTKDCTVDPNHNFLSMGFNMPGDGDRVRVRVDYSDSCTLESFIELPKKVDSPDVKNISDITKECNSVEIYNIYQRNALEMIRMRMPAAYSMFNSSNLIKRIDSTPGTTLYVYFDKRFNKFHFAYNPIFILECALDEWYLNKSSYDSLVNCYIYILAFLITHEMMHLIHHNTTSTIDMGDVGGHSIVNTMQDSFINCQIGRVFNRVSGVRGENSMAPVPRLGIGSTITVRAEHNQGFKKFDTVESLSKEILSVLSKIVKMEADHDVYVYNNTDLTRFEGADVFVSIDIDPRESSLRSNSGIFQKTINEMLKVMVKGRVYDKFSKLSDSEKESDKPILPNGTLVQVKGSSIICSVDGYDENSKQYDLIEAEMSDIIKTTMDDRSVLNTPVYTSTDKKFGKRMRRDIRPFNPEDASWIEQDGERDKKTKLSDEEIMGSNNTAPNIIDALLGMGIPKSLLAECIDKVIKDNNMESWKDSGAELIDMCTGKDPEECRDILGEIIFERLSDIFQQLSKTSPDLGNTEPQQSQMSGNGADHPVFHVGDIVWVRKLRKFGKIVSINNGKFELEEMEEIGVKVLDDSELYNSSSEEVV